MYYEYIASGLGAIEVGMEAPKGCVSLTRLKSNQKSHTIALHPNLLPASSLLCLVCLPSRHFHYSKAK